MLLTYVIGGAWPVESAGAVISAVVCPSAIVVVDLQVKDSRSRETKMQRCVVEELCSGGDILKESEGM